MLHSIAWQNMPWIYFKIRQPPLCVFLCVCIYIYIYSLISFLCGGDTTLCLRSLAIGHMSIMSELLLKLDASFEPGATKSQIHLFATHNWVQHANHSAMTQKTDWHEPCGITRRSQQWVGSGQEIFHWAAYTPGTAHIDIIFVWRRHGNMYPRTGSRVNANYEQIASWAGCQVHTGSSRISETYGNSSPTAVPGMLITRPCEKKNGFVLAVWCHTSVTAVSLFWVGTILQWAYQQTYMLWCI